LLELVQRYIGILPACCIVAALLLVGGTIRWQLNGHWDLDRNLDRHYNLMGLRIKGN